MLVFDWRYCAVCRVWHRCEYVRLSPKILRRPILPTVDALLIWLAGTTGPLPQRRRPPRAA